MDNVKLATKSDIGFPCPACGYLRNLIDQKCPECRNKRLNAQLKAKMIRDNILIYVSVGTFLLVAFFGGSGYIS